MWLIRISRTRDKAVAILTAPNNYSACASVSKQPGDGAIFLFPLSFLHVRFCISYCLPYFLTLGLRDKLETRSVSKQEFEMGKSSQLVSSQVVSEGVWSTRTMLITLSLFLCFLCCLSWQSSRLQRLQASGTLKI